MPIDYSKFDNIEDSDDEVATSSRRAPTQASQGAERQGSGISAEAAAAGAVPAKIPEEHRKPLDDAPPLELPEGAFLQYYTEKMTPPQRMQTLVQLWNSAEQDERVEFLRHLIDIIDNPAISNKIKGGQEILKDLDTNFYQGVTFPHTWVEHFKEKLSVTDKKIVFEKLFNSLDTAERGLVVGTLM